MPFHIIFEPPVGGARSVGRFACMPACRLTCRQASRMAGWTAGRLKRGQACRHSCRYNHFLKSSHPFIPVLLLGSLGIRKRCFESRNNNTYSNPFAGGLLLSRESSKVCFELPKTFRVTPQKPCYRLPLRSRVTYSDLRSFLYLRCFGNITVLYLVFQNYRL